MTLYRAASYNELAAFYMSKRHDNLPRPYNLESRAAFRIRWEKSPEVRSAHQTPAKRAIMGEKAWLRAKQDSLVSIKAPEGEFLMFGSLQTDWK